MKATWSLVMGIDCLQVLLGQVLSTVELAEVRAQCPMFYLLEIEFNFGSKRCAKC